jgi:hypothetical protein
VRPLVAATCLMLLVIAPAAGAASGPTLSALAVSSGAGFRTGAAAVATVSPDGDGYRDRALIRFWLARAVTVNVVVAGLTAVGADARNVFDRTLRLGPGRHVVRWTPRARVPARTYVVRVVVRDRDGRVHRYGLGRDPDTPRIRVLGIEAAFARDSYVPGARAALLLTTHRRALALQLFRVGVAARLPAAPLAGEPHATAVTAPVSLSLGARRGRPRRVALTVGDWPSGLYFARLSAPDGQASYAPFIVRPARLGRHRVAVVLPTYTWQAYNFRDGDLDGFGDTWYTRRTRETRLSRPYLGAGMPPFFVQYDSNFLLWLARGERAGRDRGVDVLGDADFAAVSGPRQLAALYDLIVFPGHHEYVTAREYRLVRGFRDRGGNLAFLSANNFFWRVDRRGRVLTRVAQWRHLKRPEAALVGVQYLASDRGGRRAPYVVRSTTAEPWLFDGTALRPGSRFGAFGIEIDARTHHSPRGTRVLAEIPNLLGRGRTAQMTYYETPRGAKVFAAGAFTMAGAAMQPPVSTLLDNLWARLAEP